MPPFKQSFWKIWYRYLSNRIGNDPVTFLNYGYWPPEGETLKLSPEDESNRPAIQLYHHVASGAELTGKNVLEVSCGHGGASSFVRRYHKPKTYTAIDQNPKAIDYTKHGHKLRFSATRFAGLKPPAQYMEVLRTGATSRF